MSHFNHHDSFVIELCCVDIDTEPMYRLIMLQISLDLEKLSSHDKSDQSMIILRQLKASLLMIVLSHKNDSYSMMYFPGKHFTFWEKITVWVYRRIFAYFYRGGRKQEILFDGLPQSEYGIFDFWKVIGQILICMNSVKST